MNTPPKPSVWEMVEALTAAGVVTPPLGSTDPSEVVAFDKWHWGTRSLDRINELYLFRVEAVARNIMESGPLFALSHGGHGINSYALSLLTTAPTGDAVFFAQHHFGGGYADEGQQVSTINAAYSRLASLWAELDDGARAEPVRWLVFSSDLRGETGIVDLNRARRLGAVHQAMTRLDHGALFDELKARRAYRPKVPTAPPLFTLIPRLAEALRRLEDDSHLVIGVHGSNRYVQFATFRPNLRLETIGTRYLEQGGDAMTVDNLVWLADHGWHDADDGGNLWREWIPADEDEAAKAAVEVLNRIHRVGGLDQVWFQSENDHALAALEA